MHTSKVCFAIILMFLMIFLIGCERPRTAQAAASASPGAAYPDGTYECNSALTSEGYYAKGKMTVRDGKIATMDWAIYDSRRNKRIFDKTYEEVFAGNDLYQQQCRDNLAGMAGYAPKLIETQDLSKVDVVSGATWAHALFTDMAKGLLDRAKSK